MSSLIIRRQAYNYEIGNQNCIFELISVNKYVTNVTVSHPFSIDPYFRTPRFHDRAGHEEKGLSLVYRSKEDRGEVNNQTTDHHTTTTLQRQDTKRKNPNAQCKNPNLNKKINHK